MTLVLEGALCIPKEDAQRSLVIAQAAIDTLVGGSSAQCRPGIEALPKASRKTFRTGYVIGGAEGAALSAKSWTLPADRRSSAQALRPEALPTWWQPLPARPRWSSGSASHFSYATRVVNGDSMKDGTDMLSLRGLVSTDASQKAFGASLAAPLSRLWGDRVTWDQVWCGTLRNAATIAPKRLYRCQGRALLPPFSRPTNLVLASASCRSSGGAFSMMPKAKRTSAATQEEGEGDSSQYVDDPSQSTAEVSSAPPAKKAKTGGKAKAVQRSGEVQPFENGVLRALIVENFMNHKHLRIDFDPHVNFIVGKNGSGKSAIVNALIAGFGHKASSTGRNTNSAKSLIMHGKDHALIQIHIANGGPDAYRPHEFGDTIVAEHKLERNGAGYYKLRDGTGGAVRKSSKTEFMELCTHFNIQANNPCALLTQEHAKKFLHHGDEGARYQFFLQAANLESRKHDLNATMQNVELLQSRLARAEAGMAEKKEIARKCQETYDGAKKLKELAAEEETFEALLGWALIGEKEMELEEEEKREAQALEDEERAKAEAEQAHGNQKQLEDEVAKLEREYQKAVDAITNFSASGEKAQKQVTEKLK